MSHESYDEDVILLRIWCMYTLLPAKFHSVYNRVTASMEGLMTCPHICMCYGLGIPNNRHDLCTTVYILLGPKCVYNVNGKYSMFNCLTSIESGGHTCGQHLIQSYPRRPRTPCMRCSQIQATGLDLTAYLTIEV